MVVNGCFDVLHIGHIRLLQQAGSLGRLIVGINSDESVRRLKGEGRPINCANDRAAILEALECVSAVTIFEEDTATQFLAAAIPDIWVKGSDYTRQTVNQRELAAVENVYGQVRFVDLVPGHSSTRIINALQETVPEISSPHCELVTDGGVGPAGHDLGCRSNVHD